MHEASAFAHRTPLTPRVRLGVNVDHVATIRQARGTRYPDPVAAAVQAELAGADQITVHLREDRRHIQDRDVRVLRETVQTVLNLEMAATEAMLGIALELRPDRVTLVPERREELTTEGGLSVADQSERLGPFVARLREAGIVTSMFIDPEAREIEASRAVGASAVELHTGTYAEAADGAREAKRIAAAATTAHTAGLEVAAGHGLHYRNLDSILAIPEIVELNIGHAIVAHALSVGMGEAVRAMRQAMGAPS